MKFPRTKIIIGSALIWSVRTSPRFGTARHVAQWESGDTSPHSKLRCRAIFAWLTAFCIFGATAALAHDAFLSYTDVWLRPDRLEVKCSLANFTALLLENPHPTNTLPVLDEDNFDSFVPMFKRQGEKLFELTAGGTNLVAQSVDVRLSSEGDAVDFTVIYPRPAAGPVRISPAYVKRLPDQGYGTALAVFDEAGHQLAFADNLNLEEMNLDFKIPTTTNAPPQSR